ncbi:MAG: hypothetical protein J7604_14470 [Sporocytophaga sp.]|uniref:hypothetical protein n=1 Tax=Sporocytophaga sp. TaxID=2231183 RepID=UPI001B263ADE|nr:hypothetical protein [Sporocytophaga sp.]MBO9701410.1 hypothetical protein [Sporocytophaga sp.]
MVTVKYPIVLMSVFLWLGFVFALDFLEIWIEFKPSIVSIPIDSFLSELIYNTMTNLEWFFVLLIIGTTYYTSIEEVFPLYSLFIIPFLILSIQTSKVFSYVNNDFVIFIIGRNSYYLNSSICYFALEGIKILCLLAFGLKLFRLNDKEPGMK